MTCLTCLFEIYFADVSNENTGAYGSALVADASLIPCLRMGRAGEGGRKEVRDGRNAASGIFIIFMNAVLCCPMDMSKAVGQRTRLSF
jgi:hypothetical protein